MSEKKKFYRETFIDTCCIIPIIFQSEDFSTMNEIISDKRYKFHVSHTVIGEVIKKIHQTPNEDIDDKEEATLRFMRLLNDLEIHYDTNDIELKLAINSAVNSNGYEKIRSNDISNISCAIENECDIFLTKDEPIKKCEELSKIGIRHGKTKRIKFQSPDQIKKQKK